MSAELLLPRDSEILLTLREAALERRCVFLAGLPGVGKSLLLQQLVLVAEELGRGVHLLQWDVARGAFEKPEILKRYPEVEGVTHAAIRRAVGLWARGRVGRWEQEHAEPRHLLIGETPLIGNRLIELAQRQDDDVEALLAGRQTLFLSPAPSAEVRQVIEAARVREMASPRHRRELANAPPHLVRAHWGEMPLLARRLGVAEETSSGDYDPEVYGAVYRRILRHRRAAVLPIRDVLPIRASAYELGTVASELIPTAEEVAASMALVEGYPKGQLEREVERWFEV